MMLQERIFQVAERCDLLVSRHAWPRDLVVLQHKPAEQVVYLRNHRQRGRWAGAEQPS